MNKKIKYAIFIIIGLCCLTDYISSPISLALGILVANIFAIESNNYIRKSTKYLLQISIVGLGFGINLETALKAGSDGFIFSALSIVSTMALGYFIGKKFGINNKTSTLISTGTAICGGSAIAAVAPIIEANDEDVSASLGVVFILNSIALFIFPILGHLLNLSQHQFGLWAAIAIHDTSSVVGAANAYGAEALQLATTVKLARALWIIPISFAIAFIYKKKSNKISIPWFILYYVLAILFTTYVKIPEQYSSMIIYLSKKGLNLTLYLIGAGLYLKTLKTVGIRVLKQGVLLWFFIGAISLLAVYLL